MLFTAKRAGVVECHLRIQRLVSGFVDFDAPVFQDPEICALKFLVMSRADKNKFHISNLHALFFLFFSMTVAFSRLGAQAGWILRLFAFFV